MSRPKNPRRAVYSVIKGLREDATDMVRIWGSPARHRVDGKFITAPPDMQPESQIEEWRRLSRFMRAIIDQASAVDRYAANQIRRMEREQGDGS